MDVAGSLVAMVVLLPILVLTAMFILLFSRGPIFFKQQRAGFLGRPFTMWKFRTMKTDTDSCLHQAYVGEMIGSDVPSTKLDDSYELIPCGAWLRTLCIDELPQLINVLRGDMSLVGPRPDVIPYEDYSAWQRRRFEALPGMTGLWQVSGKNLMTFAEMIELDITYVQQRSFWLDTRILLMTLPAILREYAQKETDGSQEEEVLFRK